MKRLAALAVALGVGVAGCGGTALPHHATSKPHAAPSHGYQTQYGVSAHSPTFGLPPKTFSTPPPATAVQTTAMYDSVNANALPVGSRVYAGYTSGWWPTYNPIRARFPSAKVVSIAVNTSHTAQCLDIEPGDATPAAAPGWYRADKAAGYAKPCFYASLSTWPQVTSALASAGIPRSAYFAWDANWTYVAHLDGGFDATQWTDHYNGTNVDASTVTLSFAGLQAAKPAVTNVLHYERYDSTIRHFGRVTARERNTVQTWDAKTCENPVRRSVCKSSRNHLQKLRGRLLNLHKAGRAWNKPAKPSPSGARNQQFWKRINAKKPVKSWAAGL